MMAAMMKLLLWAVVFPAVVFTASASLAGAVERRRERFQDSGPSSPNDAQ